MRKRKRTKNIIYLTTAILFLILILFLGISAKKGNSSFHETNISSSTQGSSSLVNEDTILEDVSENVHLQMLLEHDIRICELSSYTGSYVEDGSDEYVENIMMLILENEGEDDIQFGNVIINNQYVFEFTTLLPGDKVMVLEKNRSVYAEDIKIDSAVLKQAALFSEAPSMHEDLLEITTENGMICITNISGTEFSGGKLFYKNVVNEHFLGGITYFSTIPKLQSNQSVKLSADHYEEDRSRLLFVTYGQ